MVLILFFFFTDRNRSYFSLTSYFQRASQ
jgi:hypothetical protein